MPGTALVTIEKTFNGKKFVNTHGVTTGSFTGAMDRVTMQEMLNTEFLDNTGDLVTIPVNSIIWRLLAFERAMYSTVVRFTKVAISDHKNYIEGPDQSRAYKTYKLNFTGTGTYATANTLEAGGIILSITRRAFGVGQEDGEIEYRAMLVKEDTRNNGPDMLDWAGEQSRQGWGNRLTSAIDESGLETHFGAGTAEGLYAYTVPHYSSIKRGDLRDGDIIGGFPIQNLVIDGPKLRQVAGGRKRKTT